MQSTAAASFTSQPQLEDQSTFFMHTVPPPPLHMAHHDDVFRPVWTPQPPPPPTPVWNSLFFDNVDIRFTSPCYELGFTLAPNEIIHTMRDHCEDMLLLKKANGAMYMSIFRASLVFRPAEFNPRALPNDLLQSFQEYIIQHLTNELASMSKCIGGDRPPRVYLQGNFVLLGNLYPSHLGMTVDTSELRNVVILHMPAIKRVVAASMHDIARRINQRGIPGTFFAYENDSITLHGIGLGWDMRVEFNYNWSQDSQMVIGLLPSGDGEYDSLVTELCCENQDEISPLFASTTTTERQYRTSMSLHLRRLIAERMPSVRLQKLSSTRRVSSSSRSSSSSSNDQLDSSCTAPSALELNSMCMQSMSSDLSFRRTRAYHCHHGDCYGMRVEGLSFATYDALSPSGLYLPTTQNFLFYSEDL